jgi:hypothetical protein
VNRAQGCHEWSASMGKFTRVLLKKHRRRYLENRYKQNKPTLCPSYKIKKQSSTTSPSRRFSQIQQHAAFPLAAPSLSLSGAICGGILSNKKKSASCVVRREFFVTCPLSIWAIYKCIIQTSNLSTLLPLPSSPVV